MKLSFSIKGWHGHGWDEFVRAAIDMKFQAIEINGVLGTPLCEKGGPFSEHTAAATVRDLLTKNLKLACMDAASDLADGDHDASYKEIAQCIQLARNLRIPYVRLRARGEADDAAVIALIARALPLAEEMGVALLVETAGAYADTGRLCGVLNHFASDWLGALWDMHHTFREGGEAAEDTIKNLGAYVKHVHIKDSDIVDGEMNYCLLGEGSLPIQEMMNALRSVNFDGFLSLEWDPAWMPELDDMEIVFSHFVQCMGRYENPARAKNVLYDNRRHTGKYVWKKETLVEMTFSDVLDRMVKEFPDQLAFKYTTLGYTRTYSQFRDDVDQCARALIAMGVKQGTHVAIWATNLPEWYITFWAVTKIGGVLVTINTAYKIHEIEYLLRQSDTHTLVMIHSYRDSNYSAHIKQLCPELETLTPGHSLHAKKLPFLRNVVTVGYRMAGCLTWEEMIARAEQVPPEEVRRMAAQVECNDVCNMQYTSGTTGFPKGVMLTHHNIVNNGKNIGDRMDLSTADRLMIQVPMFHCFGMVLAMTAAMTHGTSIFPLPYFSPKPALACIHQERITAFHGVPTMFIALLEHEDFAKTDFRHMRTGIMAGSPCPIPVMQDVVNKMNMSEITIVYGQTESSPGCTMSSADDPLDVRVSTVGSPLPEIECRIVDPETGLDCPDGVNGEFCARGYNIMKGYYKMPKATESAIDRDGWLHTGDLAARTPEGNFRITGRLKDMIIRGGENIYPKEIEEFIYTHPKVKDVQVIGVPDQQYGEEIMACIIMKENEQMNAEEMKEYIRSHMARHKTPRYIEFVTEFPMNAAGKILKYKMREDAVEKLGLQKADAIETA